MTKLDINKPNRLLECDINVLSTDPLVGVIEMQTDMGFVPISINRAVAALLAIQLVEFLAAVDGEEIEVANDG